MKRRRISRAEVESFLSKFILYIGDAKWSNPPYYVQVEACVSLPGKEKNGYIAAVVALARVSDMDMKRNRNSVGTSIAIARAKKGIYNILKGKRIHDPLCQGSRI